MFHYTLSGEIHTLCGQKKKVCDDTHYYTIVPGTRWGCANIHSTKDKITNPNLVPHCEECKKRSKILALNPIYR